jgi:vacuolar-type H+-ATPase subunit F/Vma7
MESSSMKSIIIDDNTNFLNNLENKGYRIISIVGKSYQDIADELIEFDQIQNIVINISLLFNTKKRLDYLGVDLMSRLMFEVPAKGWTLLTFEKPKNILGKHNANILPKLKNVQIIDYIKFIEDIFHNGKY